MKLYIHVILFLTIPLAVGAQNIVLSPYAQAIAGSYALTSPKSIDDLFVRQTNSPYQNVEFGVQASYSLFRRINARLSVGSRRIVTRYAAFNTLSTSPFPEEMVVATAKNYMMISGGLNYTIARSQKAEFGVLINYVRLMGYGKPPPPIDVSSTDVRLVELANSIKQSSATNLGQLEIGLEGRYGRVRFALTYSDNFRSSVTGPVVVDGTAYPFQTRYRLLALRLGVDVFRRQVGGRQADARFTTVR